MNYYKSINFKTQNQDLISHTSHAHYKLNSVLLYVFSYLLLIIIYIVSHACGCSKPMLVVHR